VAVIKVGAATEVEAQGAQAPHRGRRAQRQGCRRRGPAARRRRGAGSGCQEG
jgi:hypothetical protein